MFFSFTLASFGTAGQNSEAGGNLITSLSMY